jgi:hypothetical protein
MASLLEHFVGIKTTKRDLSALREFMKNIVLIILFLSLLPNIHAGNKFFCATKSALKHKEFVKKFSNDKTKHCSLSCIMAVDCSSGQAALLGYLKELWDLISPGDADHQDIVANEQGIRFALQAESFSDCAELCLEVYPSR